MALFIAKELIVEHLWSAKAISLGLLTHLCIILRQYKSSQAPQGKKQYSCYQDNRKTTQK